MSTEGGGNALCLVVFFLSMLFRSLIIYICISPLAFVLLSAISRHTYCLVYLYIFDHKIGLPLIRPISDYIFHPIRKRM